MKKILIGLGSIALALTIFAGGVYANEQGWLSFTGDEQIAESENHLDEIMNILRQVSEGKITAEQGLETANERIAELEDMNPSGLAKQNKELRDEIDTLETTISKLEAYVEDNSDYIIHLESELERANDLVDSHHDETTKAVQEARTYVGDDQE